MSLVRPLPLRLTLCLQHHWLRCLLLTHSHLGVHDFSDWGRCTRAKARAPLLSPKGHGVKLQSLVVRPVRDIVDLLVQYFLEADPDAQPAASAVATGSGSSSAARESAPNVGPPAVTGLSLMKGRNGSARVLRGAKDTATLISVV